MSAVQPPLVPTPVARDVSAFVQSLLTAVRTSRMYSPDHPASAAAVDRLQKIAAALPVHGNVVIGFSATTLLVNGEPLASNDRIREAAELMHEHDILCLRFRVEPTPHELTDFLRLLCLTGEDLQTRGGPARLWESFGHNGIEIQTIDYDVLLADRGPARAGGAQANGTATGPGVAQNPPPVAHDAIWQAIVKSMSTGRPIKGLSIEQRLVEIARSSAAIAELTDEVLSSEVDQEPSARLAAQAATVLTTFQRLVRAVEAQSPANIPATMSHLAEAAAKLDPELVMRAVGDSAESGLGANITGALGRWFDDEKVAEMLAKSLAAEGKASGRMAAAVNTLVPDPTRQRRVMTLARAFAPSTGGGVAGGFESTLQSLEMMLSGPKDGEYASADYSASIGDAETRSYELSLSTPAEMDAWIQTVSSEGVRTLSTSLLLDLFSLEDRTDRIVEAADSLAVLAEELLLSADVGEVERIVQALRTAVSEHEASRSAAADRAIVAIARSSAMGETCASVADFEDAQVECFGRCCKLLGTSALDTLVPALGELTDGPGQHRLEQLIEHFGDDAVAPLADLVASENWSVCCSAIQILGRIATPSAIAGLWGGANDGDPRRTREVVIALMRIGDISSIRPISEALRGRVNARRRVLVDALASSGDHRAGLPLAELLDGIDPLGSDHALALHVLGGLRLVGDDRVIPAVSTAMRASKWTAVIRANRLKRTATRVLKSMNSPAAVAAIDEAAATGDWLLKRHALRARRAGA